MSTGKRIKQFLMLTGLVTVLAVTALVGVVAYLWWDTRGEPDYEAESDYEPTADLDDEPDVEAADSDDEAGATAD